MRSASFAVATAALLLLVGAGCAKGVPAEPTAGKVSAPTRPEDAVYVVEGEPVTLRDGIAVVADAPDSASRVTTRLFGKPFAADLDGDGDQDAAVMLQRETSGTGTFYYVAAAVTEDGYVQGTEAVLLGDRIAPQTLEVHDGVIVANYAVREPGEPMTTAPNIGVSKYFRLDGGRLTETSPTP